MIQRLSLTEFRRRVVAGFFPDYRRLSDAFQTMQFVQADPIRSPARAQDLVLRQRVRGYLAGDLETKYPSLGLEEGYLFAYGFMTPEVWRHLSLRPHKRLTKRERAVLEAVDELGEAHPRHLGERFGRKSVRNYWGGKSQEVKQHLEKLHHHGYLRVTRRENGIRVYQVPGDTHQTPDDPWQRYRFLAMTTARVFGPTTKRFLVSELRSHNHLLTARGERLAAVEMLVESGQLAELSVAGVTYLWAPADWTSTELSDRVRILAPFDPLVRDRERFQQLWGWEYRFEAYVPPAKRERGYYTMPLLWRDKVIGWANANVVDERLQVELGFVGKRPRTKTFAALAEDEIESMTRFLGLESGQWKLTYA